VAVRAPHLYRSLRLFGLASLALLSRGRRRARRSLRRSAGTGSGTGSPAPSWSARSGGGLWA